MLNATEIGKAFLILFAVIDVIGGIPMILQVRQQAGVIYPVRIKRVKATGTTAAGLIALR